MVFPLLFILSIPGLVIGCLQTPDMDLPSVQPTTSIDVDEETTTETTEPTSTQCTSVSNTLSTSTSTSSSSTTTTTSTSTTTTTSTSTTSTGVCPVCQIDDPETFNWLPYNCNSAGFDPTTVEHGPSQVMLVDGYPNCISVLSCDSTIWAMQTVAAFRVSDGALVCGTYTTTPNACHLALTCDTTSGRYVDCNGNYPMAMACIDRIP
ncbi:hypothetical protein WR25_12090 [Diploscapter pachys]|uniref:DUF281 domain-containing protein n=1 Tax=Diploscapter pachys TaxID=2018661 RepID=A0A2A2JD04_9BILA|nr:hypothetical protein WR25_12090 [Diploscapter pachys]